jgi:pimeloyl-ACP methyl ester carboxylesterase
VLYVPSATKGSALPLVVWAHGTTGIARNCAPSLLGEQAGGLTATAALLDDGYAVLALDLTGLGSAGPSSYLLGTGEARAVLDGIRAVRRVPGILVGSSVLWGYEQGGHAVLWAAELAPTYAPDVVLSGVVAVAPATDLTALFTAAIAAGSAGTLGTDLLETYSARYSDVTLRDYTGAGPALLDEVAAHCRGARGLVGEAWAQVSGFDQAWTMPDTSALASRLAENTPAGPFAEAVLVVQGASDTTVPAVVQDDWVQARCSSGVRLEYRKLAGADHADVVRNGSVAVTGILAWITDRFAGTSVPGTCE